MSDISSPDFERTGQAGFAVARQTMSARLSEAEIQARNELPTCVSNGDPFRVIAEEVQVEHADATHWRHEDEGGVGPAAHAPLKPGVLREVSKVTDRIPKKLGLENMSENDPEYWGIASVMTEEEAELTKHMKVRIPETLSQMVEGSGMPAGRVQELLDALCVKGIIEYNWENLDGTNPTHERRFVLPMFVPGMAEFTVMNQQQMVEHPEIGSMFERMTFLPLTKVTKMVPQGGAGIGMHVIPVERAITHENVSADVEHLSHWLRKYDRYAAGACSCTVSERARNSNAGRDAQNWCIGVGDMADYLFETGKGHYISYDEVIETLIRAEKNGYVHQITNIDGQDKIFAICNCDVNVCYALRTSQLFNTPNMSRSAYVAHVDSERCVACGGCVEICPAGAAQLGQKLCTDHGPQSYPQQPLPDDRPWGEEDWDPDYKNNNRIECHETGTAPCKTACPAHVSVQGYLRLAAEGRYRDALALIKQENPFPAVCGRVCNRRCEDACTRGTVDDAVAIDEVKRFVATKDLQSESRYVPEPRIPSNRGRLPQKVAIVGAGPAGLTCAYYLANMGYSPVVFERNPLPGGMLTYGIPAYKLQKDVVAAEIDVMREMGVEIRCGVEVGRDVTLAQLREQGFAAFYLAIGCQGGRRAGIEGEGGPDVCSAVDFLHQAIEEPQLEVSGTTVVVGGGNVAIDASRVSLRCGASSVAMVCLEQEDQMPALPVEREEARADGVAISCGWGPTRVERDEGGKVTGVSFRRCLSVFDENGRFTPLFDDSDTMLVPCDRVVMAIGQSVVWGDLLADESVDLRPNGGPLADSKTYQTAQKDVFVGGDAFTGPRFAIDAIAAGHEAAVSIHRFVQVGSSLTLGRNQRHYVELDKEHLTLPQNMSGEGRQAPTVDEVTSILHNWSDPKRCFTEEQIKIECARCLGCGASIVDPNKCIGCGLCTTRCEFDAIHLTRDNPGCSTMSPSEEKIRKILPYAAKRGIKILRNKATGRAGR